MSTIEFSSGFMSALPQRIIRYNDDTGSNSSYTSGLLPKTAGGNFYFACSYARLLIMKGAVPTDFSTLTSYSSRATDILVQFNTPSSPAGVSSDHFTLVQQTVNPAVISTQYATASASGDATWFWWQVLGSNGAGGLAGAPVHQIIGTLGTVGSGADLEIETTSVAQGEEYRILNLRILFPSSWTY